MKKTVVLYLPIKQPSEETNEYVSALNDMGAEILSVQSGYYHDPRLDGTTFITIRAERKVLRAYKKNTNVVVIRRIGMCDIWLPTASKEDKQKIKRFLFKGIEA